MNTKKVGDTGECIAIKFLTNAGMKVIERNFHSRNGEIDIIGYHDNYLVFIEVKYRRNDNKGNSAEAVDFRKQKKICKLADYYRYIHKIEVETPIRYDVVAIDGEKVKWIKDAFPHVN